MIADLADVDICQITREVLASVVSLLIRAYSAPSTEKRRLAQAFTK
jgi:hypothetical protein